MSYRIAINGYGRIGRCLLRALHLGPHRNAMQIVAINELSDLATASYLTRYDTTHGRFPGAVHHEADKLCINDQAITFLSEPDISQLDWRAQDIDLLMECSGSFTQRALAEQHIAQGAKALLFSQPAATTVDATIVYGVNEATIRSSDTILSAASCTTNCIIPVLTLLDQHFGIEHGTITTIHSVMNDQPVIDAYNPNNLRLTRAALSSIIPVETGLIRGIERIIPHFAGKFCANSVRVPTINVSAMDVTLSLQQDVKVSQINQLFYDANHSKQQGRIIGFTDEPHASVDFNQDSRSVIVDGTQTSVSGKRLLRLLCWFDNEWAFANRMLDLGVYWLNQRTQRH